MKFDDLDTRMRSHEYFHSLKIPPQNWIVLRLDGRGFSKFTAQLLEKPFDPKFHGWMVECALRLVKDFGALYGYTESDEISLLLPYDWKSFDRELEKTLSLSASLASSVFTAQSGQVVQFDSRVWMAAERQSVVDYFRWRQSDAGRCALNGWAYWTLRKAGQDARQATQQLKKLTTAEKNELLFQHGINFNEVPCWQRRGTGIWWESYSKEGFNPKTGQPVQATRRRLLVEENLPMKEEYGQLIRSRVDEVC